MLQNLSMVQYPLKTIFDHQKLPKAKKEKRKMKIRSEKFLQGLDRHLKHPKKLVSKNGHHFLSWNPFDLNFLPSHVKCMLMVSFTDFLVRWNKV